METQAAAVVAEVVVVHVQPQEILEPKMVPQEIPVLFLEEVEVLEEQNELH